MKGIDSSVPRTRVGEYGDTHEESFRLHMAPELLSTGAVDVVEGQMVDCPRGCVYAALSHV